MTDWTTKTKSLVDFGHAAKKAKLAMDWQKAKALRNKISEEKEKDIETAKSTPVTKEQKGQNRDALEIARLEEEKRQNPDTFSKAKQRRLDKLRKRSKK